MCRLRNNYLKRVKQLSHLNFFEKHPLLLLQIMGWSVYLIADLFDHFAKGHYLLLPSFVCSITAFILTGGVAYLTNRLELKGKQIQAFFFITAILLVTILWHKIWSIFHGESETIIQMWQQFKGIPSYSLSQWLPEGFGAASPAHKRFGPFYLFT